MSVFEEIRHTIRSSFDEKVEDCAEKKFFFSDTIKRSHDNSECCKDCRVSWFADELFLYLRYKNRYSSRLAKKFLIYLSEKYPRGFSDNYFNYFVYKNKTL